MLLYPRYADRWRYARTTPWVWDRVPEGAPATAGRPELAVAVDPTESALDAPPAQIDLRRWVATAGIIHPDAGPLVITPGIIASVVATARSHTPDPGHLTPEPAIMHERAWVERVIQHLVAGGSQTPQDCVVYALARAHGRQITVRGKWVGIARRLAFEAGPDQDDRVQALISDLSSDDLSALRDHFLPPDPGAKHSAIRAIALLRDLAQRHVDIDLDAHGELILSDIDPDRHPHQRLASDQIVKLQSNATIIEIRAVSWHLREVVKVRRMTAERGTADAHTLVIASAVEAHHRRRYDPRDDLQGFLTEAESYELAPVICPRTGQVIAPDWDRWWAAPPDFKASWGRHAHTETLRQILLHRVITLAEIRATGYEAIPGPDDHSVYILPDASGIAHPQPPAEMLARVAASAHLLRQRLLTEEPQIGIHHWEISPHFNEPILVPAPPEVARHVQRVAAFRAPPVPVVQTAAE